MSHLKFEVFQYKKSICVELIDEIILINKQHESYYILDSIRKNNPQSNLILFHDGILITITNNKI